MGMRPPQVAGKGSQAARSHSHNRQNYPLKTSKNLIVAMISLPGICFADAEDAEVQSLVLFVLDATTYEGMFYSVYDFCAPVTSQLVANVAITNWKSQNNSLFAAKELAEQKYLKIMRSRDVEDEAKAKLNEIEKETFSRARDHNRLYKDLLPVKDKYMACAQRLGAMSSDGMSFKNIAPVSYNYWHTHL